MKKVSENWKRRGRERQKSGDGYDYNYCEEAKKEMMKGKRRRRRRRKMKKSETAGSSSFWKVEKMFLGMQSRTAGTLTSRLYA